MPGRPPVRRPRRRETDEGIEPPPAEQSVGGQAEQDGAGEVGAQEILDTFAGGGAGVQATAQPLFGDAQPRHDRDGHRGQRDPEPAGSGVAAGDELVDRLDGDVRGQEPERDRDRPSRPCLGVGDNVREPVKRQITITLASPSTTLDSAHPTSAMEAAARPVARPTAPSTVIQARLNQLSAFAWRVAFNQAASRTVGRVGVQHASPQPSLSLVRRGAWCSLTGPARSSRTARRRCRWRPAGSPPRRAGLSGRAGPG